MTITCEAMRTIPAVKPDGNVVAIAEVRCLNRPTITMVEFDGTNFEVFVCDEHAEASKLGVLCRVCKDSTCYGKCEDMYAEHDFASMR